MDAILVWRAELERELAKESDRIVDLSMRLQAALLLLLRRLAAPEGIASPF